MIGTVNCKQSDIWITRVCYKFVNIFKYAPHLKLLHFWKLKVFKGLASEHTQTDRNIDKKRDFDST
jgi:ABC-type amino acid transport system permease subunit